MSGIHCFQCRTDTRERVFCCDECQAAAEGRASCTVCKAKCSTSAIPTARRNGVRNTYCSRGCLDHAVALLGLGEAR